MTATEHRNLRIYQTADGCDHPEPDEPGTDYDEDDPAWKAYDDWFADHEYGIDGERLCMLEPMGLGCLACSEAADLPPGEYVECHDEPGQAAP